MTTPHGIPTGDSGEREAAGELSTEDLARMAETPASELFVRNESRRCWVKRWVRGTRIKLAFVLGVVAAIQVGGVVAVRAVVETVVRKTVLDVLKEHKLIVLDEAGVDILLAQDHAHAETKGSAP